jgi:Na+-driven multidrug efflux pump
MGVVFQLIQLARKNGRIHIGRAQLRLDTSVLLTIVRISGTGIVQSLIGMTSWIGLIRVLSSFGSDAVAGFTIAIRIIMFALLPSWGMSNAAATLVGQNLGAKSPDRAEKSAWVTCRYNLVFLCAIGLLFALFAEHLIAIFTSDPVVARFGINCLRIVSLGFPFYAYGMVLTQAFNGAGDTFTPTLINLFCFWLWEIPIALLLSKYFGFGPQGVFIAMTIAFSSLAVLSAALFKRGKWKLQKV